MDDARDLMLAIDLGTSGAKAAVVAVDGRLLSTGRAAIGTRLLPGHGVEQDPDEVWEAVVAAARAAAEGCGAAERVRGVAVASQFSSLVPVDGEGRATHPMILWMDQRGAPAALARLPGGRRLAPGPIDLLRWIRIHGIPPLDSGTDSLAHARWLKLARPEAYARTRALLEPMDFVNLRLTGRAATNACAAFLMLLVDNRDLRHPRWAPGLVRRSGLDPDKLPELLPVDGEVGTVRPEVARRLGIPATARVVAALNDTQAGALGAFALSGDHAGISIGTSSVLVTHVGFKRTDVRNALVSMPGPIPGRYLVMAENGIGGRALEHFLEKIVFARDGFGDHTLDDRLAALDDAVRDVPPGAGGVLFLPWLAGSLAPAEDGRVRGGFLNMSLETTRAHLGRAVLEGVAFNFRWLLDAVERFTRRRLSHVVFYGGGAASRVWSQILADVLQRPVHVLAQPSFAAARGAAFHGFHRLGHLDLDALEQRVPVERVAPPRPELAGRYDLLFSQFVRAFRSNRRLFHALNPRSAERP